MELNDLTHAVIGAAIEVHRVFGPGLLEEAYEEALCVELSIRGIPFQRQVRVPLRYKGRQLKKDYVLDLLVDRRLVVECKATFEDHPIYRSQCLTQLKITDLRLGLVINFGQRTLKSGIHRVANDVRPTE